MRIGLVRFYFYGLAILFLSVISGVDDVGCVVIQKCSYVVKCVKILLIYLIRD